MICVCGWHLSRHTIAWTVINIYICYILRNRVASCRFVCSFSILVNEFHCFNSSPQGLSSMSCGGFLLLTLFTLNITCSPLHNFKCKFRNLLVRDAQWGKRENAGITGSAVYQEIYWFQTEFALKNKWICSAFLCFVWGSFPATTEVFVGFQL